MKSNSPNKPIRVAIVEDDGPLKKILVDALEESGDIKILGTFSDAESAVKHMPALKPDVAVVDIGLPGMDGVECVRRLKPQLPTTQFMMFTVYEDNQRLYAALAAGATGYLLKRASRSQLAEAVREIHEGGSPITSNIARKLVLSFQPQPKQGKNTEQVKLGPRENEILGLLAQGYSYKEIADQLQLSVRTIGSHIRSIYEKLHVHSRSQAVAKFLGV
jgi:DNA-binding NarL/FixJ family response regulator